MGFWIFTLFILIIIGYFRFQKINKKHDEIEQEFGRLKKEFSSLYNLFLEIKNSGTIPKAETFSVQEETKLQGPTTAVSKEAAKLPPAGAIPPAPEMPPPSPLPPRADVPPSMALKSSDKLQSVISSAYVGKKESQQALKQETQKPSSAEIKWQEFKANVDWEQFTGIKLFAWLGGLALFIAAIFFVKYSIDNNLIPPQVRLAMGALVGLIMIVGSLIIDREQYKTTAHSLAAGGIAVLYAISFTATVYYGFIPKLAGFGLFSLISAAAFVLAVFLKGRFISVLGAVGAYATPLLIQTGHPNLIGLFFFLTVVNLGLFEVIRRTDWLPLYVLVAAGTLFTLSAGAWGTQPPAENYLICIIALANLILFSVFFWLYRGRDPANRSVVISLRLLFLSILAVALVMINETGWLPLLVVCVATLAAMILSYKEKSWSVGFILYTFIGFILILLWAVWKFDFREPSWGMIIFFAYALIAGLGPVFVIKKNGVEPHSLQWLKVFPVALVFVAVVVFFKTQSASFLFWPLLLGLNIIGIFISLIVGSIFSVVLLTLMLLAAGTNWVLKTPSIQIGNEFFLTILFAGLLLCFVTLLFLKKARNWNPLAGLEEVKGFLTPAFITSSAWISALPVLGPFLLLALVLFRQQPVAPNPAMATGLCFFAVVIFLVQRIKSQELLVVSLAALALTETSWGLMLPQGDAVNMVLLGWSVFFWLTAVILPNLMFRPEKDWKVGWYGWAIFELIQALLIIRASDAMWEREFIGWFPLALAILKLPVVAILVKHLEGAKERNAILAFHGGVLLFYVSSIAVLLLGNAWLGLTLVLEAMLLLWLNRRVEHPGLRWVSLGAAPIGLLLLLTHLNALKTAQDMPVLNLAIMSIAICVAALSVSVKWSGFPQKELAPNFSLPNYFLWLAIGTGFYLVNLIVADIFGGVGGGFKFNFDNNINQYISYCLLWSMFGAFLWRVGNLPKGLKILGLILLLVGSGMSLWGPIRFSIEIGNMPPFINPGLIIFIPVIIIMFFLATKQSEKDFGEKWAGKIFIFLGLTVGLVALNVALATVFQNRIPFDYFARPLPYMSLALIVSWFIYGFILVLWPKPLDNNFRLAGVALIIISLVRACFFPVRYAGEFGSMTPIINIPSLIFLLIISGLVLLTVKRFKHEWVWEQISNPGNLWGTLLVIFTFYVMNVEVASFFGTFNVGTEAGKFTFYTHGRLSQQLAYSISWLLFSLALLIIGIRWNLVRLRWVGLGLIVVTALKVFLKDLWALGSLYRVFSFIGLAVTLMLVSFLYQRYFGSRKKEGEKE
jgi:uncharacterized membrane protein